MNERDSEAISGILEEMGLTRIDDYREAYQKRLGI